MAPDLRRRVDAARIARVAREAEQKKQVDARVSLGSLCHSYIQELLLLPSFPSIFALS